RRFQHGFPRRSEESPGWRWLGSCATLSPIFTPLGSITKKVIRLTLIRKPWKFFRMVARLGVIDPDSRSVDLEKSIQPETQAGERFGSVDSDTNADAQSGFRC